MTTQSTLAEFLQQEQITLEAIRQICQSQLQNDLQTVLERASLPKILGEACQYAMNNGGKRVRPLLVLAAAMSVGKRPFVVQSAAMICRAMLALEMIHGYSLVHDDLPCMDDDDLRRGVPTCHVVYGEAVAMLVGDVLQSLAFETLTNDTLGELDTVIAHRLSAVLSVRARRMVTGQMLDLLGENQSLDDQQLQAIHRDKTGALIEAAVLMGGICVQASDEDLQKLQHFAQAVGLAFQVQDDVLDVVADTQTLGKPAGSDEKLDKSTYVKLMGVSGASQYAQQLFDQARQAVADFGQGNPLLQIVDWLQQRQY